MTARFVQLCVIFTKHRTDLTPEERKEVVTFFRSRLPVFVSQVYRLLKCFRNVIGGLSASQNFVLANYIVPEVFLFSFLLTYENGMLVMIFFLLLGGWRPDCHLVLGHRV